MLINANTSKSFVELAKFHKAMHLLVGNTRIEAICASRDAEYEVIRYDFENLMKTPMLRNPTSRELYRDRLWQLTQDRSFIGTVQNKVDLVKVLTALQVDAEVLKRLKTIKASQLREVFDTTPVIRDDAKVEIEEVMLRLTSAKDRKSVV